MVTAGVEKWRQFYCFSLVHLPFHCFGIIITNEAYLVITNVEITVSSFNFQVTESNSQLLNRVQMVTDSNKMVILPFTFIYCIAH
jgi:hypothetical protein